MDEMNIGGLPEGSTFDPKNDVSVYVQGPRVDFRTIRELFMTEKDIGLGKRLRVINWPSVDENGPPRKRPQQFFY